MIILLFVAKIIENVWLWKSLNIAIFLDEGVLYSDMYVCMSSRANIVSCVHNRSYWTPLFCLPSCHYDSK